MLVQQPNVSPEVLGRPPHSVPRNGLLLEQPPFESGGICPRPKPLPLASGPWQPNLSQANPPGRLSVPGLNFKAGVQPLTSPIHTGPVCTTCRLTPNGTTPFPTFSPGVYATALAPAVHFVIPSAPRKNGRQAMVALTATPCAPKGIEPPPIAPRSPPACVT